MTLQDKILQGKALQDKKYKMRQDITRQDK